MATDAAARALQGTLSLRFALRAGQTRLVEAARTPPLQVQRLLPIDPAAPGLAGVLLLNGTAGLFAGDRLRITVAVEAGATVAIGTPAMTRAFAMPAGDAAVETALRIAANARLEYLPEPTLLCAGAHLRQRLRIDVEPGAAVAAGEVIAFGRVAHGELHAYRHFVQETELWRAGRPVLVERLLLSPAQADVGMGALGDAAAYGSLSLLCPPAQTETLLAQVRALLNARCDVWGGASLLHEDAGVAVRLLGASATAVQALARAIVRLSRAPWRA